MKEISLTCIECPLGCDVTVTLNEDKVENVVGNSCPRGKLYATEEVVCPKRVLTTTVRADNGKMVSVKSDKPIKKSELFNAIKTINGVVAKLPVKVGDVIIKNIYEGVNIISCVNLQ